LSAKGDRQGQGMRPVPKRACANQSLKIETRKECRAPEDGRIERK
jgi:hypothetical protein